MVPYLSEQAVATEQRRSMLPAAVEEIAATGIQRCLTPRRWGGYELGFETAAATTKELARGCASSAWCTMFIAAHAWLVCHYPDPAQSEVFADGPDVRVAGIFAPMGRARRVEDGYVLSGEWPWASNIEHSGWLIGGGFVEGDAPPHLHFFLMDSAQFEWRDTWFNVGLCGTGSHTAVVQDAFVPEHRVIPFEYGSEGLGPGVASNPNPMYRTPFPTPFGTLVAMVTLGAVRGAYEQFRDWTRDRASGTTGLGVAERLPVQIALTETAAEIDAAELLLQRCIERSCAPDTLDYRTRVTCRRDANVASRLLIRAIDRLQLVGAARGLMADNPLQRAWRDAHAAAAHILF
ncbi:MAG: acyl-CoA dehydrogenase family protein, partial [Myxococcota bacterium]